MNVHPGSDWSAVQIEEFLEQARIPMRLACVGKDDFPIVASLWFCYRDGELWSATHQSAHLVKQLREHSRVGFEIATNEYPYRGVRGKAVATLVREGAEEVLRDLIARYLGDSNRELADWLLSRADEEYLIRLTPKRFNAWDFSDRMQS